MPVNPTTSLRAAELLLACFPATVPIGTLVVIARAYARRATTCPAYRRGFRRRSKLNIRLGQYFKVEGRIVFGEQSRAGEDFYD